MGVSGQQQSQYNKLTSSSDFATGLGESDLTASSNFMQGLLSGDPTKISTVLAPQTKAIQDRTQQAKDTTAQFAPRSGGTAATTANLGTEARSDIASLTGDLTGKAASTLGSEGAGLLSAGMSGNIAGFGEASELQQQKLAQFNDIISSIAKTIAGIAGMPGVSAGAAQGLNAAAGAIS